VTGPQADAYRLRLAGQRRCSRAPGQHSGLADDLFLTAEQGTAGHGAADAITREPLVIAEQGHFFTALKEVEHELGTSVTGMHVQYQIPVDVRHDPLVLVHGGGGQGLDMLATPERPETAEYLRRCGAHVTEMRLAELGILGNGHAMMLERNNAEIVTAITRWITGVLGSSAS
jgi:hypothetical protein